MPLTRPIPEVAYPVLEILRAEVPRPGTLPIPKGTSACYLRWNSYCPMGLHLDSTWPTPASRVSFAGGKCSSDAIEAFADWFDGQTDPQAAVDAIWPTEPGGSV